MQRNDNREFFGCALAGIAISLIINLTWIGLVIVFVVWLLRQLGVL